MVNFSPISKEKQKREKKGKLLTEWEYDTCSTSKIGDKKLMRFTHKCFPGDVMFENSI